MTQQQLQSIILNGENTTVEFKKCTTELTHSVFETVCSFFKSDGWAETLFDRANLLIKKILNKEERSLNEDKRPLNENKRLKRPLNEDKWPLKRPLNECERPINGRVKNMLQRDGVHFRLSRFRHCEARSNPVSHIINVYNLSGTTRQTGYTPSKIGNTLIKRLDCFVPRNDEKTVKRQFEMHPREVLNR